MPRKINYNLIIEDPSEKEFYKQTHNKILTYVNQKDFTTFWQIVKHVQGSDRRVLRLLNQMVLAGELKLKKNIIYPINQFNTKDLAADAYCGLCDNKGVLLGERFLDILDKMRKIYTEKPFPTFLFDQRPVNVETTVSRVAYLALRGDLTNKRIAVIGDDDLTSIAVGLTFRAREVVVFDIDKQLVKFINRIAKEKGLIIKAYEYDLTKTIPKKFFGKFDVFLTDPTPKEDAFNLFVSIGINLLKKGEGYSGYVSFFPSHQNKSHGFQKILSDKKVIITDMIPQFTEYDFIKETYKEEDFATLRKFYTPERKLSFYENLTRFETSNETLREVPKLKKEALDNFIGKATRRVLDNPSIDPRFISGDKSVLDIAQKLNDKRMNKFLKYYNSEIKKYGGLKEYVKAKAIEKKPLLDMIKKHATGGMILEAGCGSAVNSIALVNSGFKLVSLDKDQEIVKFAEENAYKIGRAPTILEWDISNLKEFKKVFDVSFSHGVLEHYPDEQIIKLINEQLSAAKTVIFSVPSNFFKQSEAINGDERFLSEDYWKKLISKTKGKLIESFGYFYDSDNIKIKTLKLISILTLNKFPTKKPYIGFVISRR